MRGSEIEPRLPPGGRGLADLRPGIADRPAAIGWPLIDRFRGCAHDDVEPIKREIEFFGGNLRQRGFRSGSHIHLTGEQRGGVVRMDRNPGIEPAASGGTPSGNGPDAAATPRALAGLNRLNAITRPLERFNTSRRPMTGEISFITLLPPGLHCCWPHARSRG